MPRVSVVMPVYNGERFLAEAIESILAQTFEDFEFIIVDDGSGDRSADIIADYARKDERIRIVTLPRNMGEAAARNAGNASARGEYIATMDADDISLPARLQKQVEILNAHPAIGAVSAWAHKVDASLRYLEDIKPPPQHSAIVFGQFFGISLVHPALMLRRRLYATAGGYDETMSYAADSEFASRLMGHTRFANVPECLYRYRQHPNATSARLRQQQAALARAAWEQRVRRLWRDAPEATLRRFAKMRFERAVLPWRERRAAKRDIQHIITLMADANWVYASEIPQLVAAMNRLLEYASPRLWQKYCHWRRHHFGGGGG